MHNDVSIVMPTTSMNGYRYFMTFIDDYSRFCWIYFLKKKSEVFETFIFFKGLVENNIGNTIKELRSDNGGEQIKRYF